MNNTGEQLPVDEAQAIFDAPNGATLALCVTQKKALLEAQRCVIDHLPALPLSANLHSSSFKGFTHLTKPNREHSRYRPPPPFGVEYAYLPIFTEPFLTLYSFLQETDRSYLP